MKVRDILTDESKWCKGTRAVTVENEFCSPLDPRAVKWCLVGAIEKAYGRGVEYTVTVMKVLKEVNYSAFMGPSGIAYFNDSIGIQFKDVRNLVERLDI